VVKDTTTFDYNFKMLEISYLVRLLGGKFPFRTLYDLPGLWRDLLHRDVNKWYQ